MVAIGNYYSSIDERPIDILDEHVEINENWLQDDNDDNDEVIVFDELEPDGVYLGLVYENTNNILK